MNNILIECSDNYSKTSGGLWQYYKDEPNATLTNSESFESKAKTTGKISANCNIKDFKMPVPLKYFSNIWKTLEMPLIKCEINLIVTWLAKCIINYPK